MSKTPAEKAQTTRRIRKRAAEWRAQTRPDTSALTEGQAAEIDLASRPVDYFAQRPPLATALQLGMIAKRVGEIGTRLATAAGRRHDGSYWHKAKPGTIGALRSVRAGLAFAAALPPVQPQPTRLEGIWPGDLVEHGGELKRVASVRRYIETVRGQDIYRRPYGDERFAFTLDGGEVVDLPEREPEPEPLTHGYSTLNALRDRLPPQDYKGPTCETPSADLVAKGLAAAEVERKRKAFDRWQDAPWSAREWRASRAKDREAMAAEIERTAKHFGATCEREAPLTGETRAIRLKLRSAGKACSISLNGDVKDSGLWMLWHSNLAGDRAESDRRLADCFGAAAGGTVNQFHRGKCSAWAPDFRGALFNLALALHQLLTGDAFEDAPATLPLAA